MVNDQAGSFPGVASRFFLEVTSQGDSLILTESLV